MSADLASWKTRARRVRDGLWRGLGLDPLPPRTPLNAVLHSRREREGYSIENLYFESLPGVWVPGNLYRTLSPAGRVPAILHPHGHFKQEGWTARTRPDHQLACAQLAKMGAVCFAWDMVGWGESTQLDHALPFVMALQLWNSLRAVDFVAALPEVDGARIGVTGVSGGGSQAIFLAALDRRIAALAPVAMVSSEFHGGCDCEIGMPIRDDTDNVEISALFAPRPALFVSVGGDWTRTFPAVDHPRLQSIWRLHDAERALHHLHLPDEGHDLGPSKRAALYSFFARTFALAEMPLDSGAPLPEGLPIEPVTSLTAFDDDHPRPPAMNSADVAALLYTG